MVSTRREGATSVKWAAVSGIISGTMSTMLFHPLDVAKTSIINPESGISGAKRNSIMSVWKGIIQTEGYCRIWRGVTPAVVRIGIGSGVYFTVQASLMQLPRSGETLSLMGIGAVSRAASVIVCCPISVIKTRMEGTDAAKGRTLSIMRVARDIHQSNGISGFYRGLIASLIKDVPYSSFYLLLYARAKPVFVSSLPDDLGHICGPFMAAFTSASLITTALQPVEVIKTRLQLATSGDIMTQHTVRTISASILASSGWRGFFAGLVPRVLRRGLATAWSWTMFETIQHSVTAVAAV